MEDNRTKPKFLKGIFAIIFIIAMLYYFLGGGLEKQAGKNLTQIENKVAQDAVDQYEIAKRGGDKMDIYTHASMVTAAYLQAKDEMNYSKWKTIQKAAAKDAGLPDQ